MSEQIRDYRDLLVWQKSMDLAVECYRATSGFPADERFGLTSQTRRAAASIPANIAEGRGRQHTKEFVHFLGIARGSLMELETHMQLAARLGFLAEQEAARLLACSGEVGRMLAGLCRSLRARTEGVQDTH